MTNKSYSVVQKSLAWLVHILTASGLVAGFLAIIATDDSDYRLAMFWLICAAIVDAVDGTFARKVKVEKVLPLVNGKMIDAVVDFVNYAVVPAYMLHSAQVFPDALNIVLVGIILITSAVYYGKDGMIAEEMYFIGFPVLWNVLAFYILFVLPSNEIVNVLIVIIFAVMHFIPLKFAYPSRKSTFQKLHLIFSAVFLISMLLILYCNPEKNMFLNLTAYLCGFYFLGMAVYDTYFKK